MIGYTDNQDPVLQPPDQDYFVCDICEIDLPSKDQRNNDFYDQLCPTCFEQSERSHAAVRNRATKELCDFLNEKSPVSSR